MKRRSRMIRKLCVYLLLGAIVNVAAAWGFAVFRAAATIERSEQGHFVIWNRPWSMVQQRSVGMIDVWWYDLHDENPRSIAPESLVSAFNEENRQRRESGLPMPSGRPRMQLSSPPRWGTFRDDPLPSDIFMGGDIAFGFPMMSLWMWTTNDLIGNSTTNEQLHGGWLMRGQIESRGNEFIALPHLILWPGFAINTVFYATVLWLLHATPGFMRRRLRTRRGLCPACAYPVGASDVCTECGRPVSPRATA